MVVPIILNRIWIPAVLLAAVEPPIEAKIPVTVVPILAPNTNGNTALNVNAPASYIFCTTPIVAADACTAPVMIVPASSDKNGFLDIASAKDINAGTSLIAASSSPIEFKPKKIKPKPRMI